MQKIQVKEPQQTSCAICNRMVNKRSTVPIGPKERACKTHPEAQKMNEDFVRKQVRAKAEPFKEEQKKERKQNIKKKEKFQARPLTCFCCEKDGVFIADFYLRLALEMEKMEMVGQMPNLFSPAFVEKLRENLSEKERRAIAVLDVKAVNDEYGNDVLAKLVRMLKDKRPLVVNTLLVNGRLCFCVPCLTEHKLEYLTQPKNKPNLSTEQMFMIGSAMKPVLREYVEAEMEEKDKKE